MGIAIAIAAMIVVLSVINGFETNLRDRFLAANAHVMMYKFPSGLKNSSATIEKVEQNFGSEIKGVSPFVHMQTMVKSPSNLHSVLVRGIIPSLREPVQPTKKLIRPPTALDILEREAKESTSTLPGVIIGSGLLKLMNVEVGQVVEFISPMNDDPLSSVKSFKIVGVYDSGLSHYDNQLAIMSIPAAQKLFNMKNTVTGLEIGLKNPNQSPQFANNLESEFPSMNIKQWQDYNKTMFEAIEYERSLIAILVALVAVVGGFNILTTLFVSVVQKGKDIAVLKSLGTLNHQIVAIFVKQGFFMGLAGSLGGTILAYLIANLLERYQFIKLPEIYMLESLPVDYDLSVYVITAVFGVFISTAAGALPAWNAAKATPSEGLKNNHA